MAAPGVVVRGVAIDDTLTAGDRGSFRTCSWPGRACIRALCACRNIFLPVISHCRPGGGLACHINTRYTAQQGGSWKERGKKSVAQTGKRTRKSASSSRSFFPPKPDRHPETHRPRLEPGTGPRFLGREIVQRSTGRNIARATAPLTKELAFCPDTTLEVPYRNSLTCRRGGVQRMRPNLNSLAAMRNPCRSPLCPSRELPRLASRTCQWAGRPDVQTLCPWTVPWLRARPHAGMAMRGPTGRRGSSMQPSAPLARVWVGGGVFKVGSFAGGQD